LAFQGGGAKAVSYTGVFKALKELHRSTPITSIIGSSAGGLLALAIGTEMKPEAMSDLSLRMENIPKDKSYCSEKDI
jgi:predicted acylesterase/phospholipase RssA